MDVADLVRAELKLLRAPIVHFLVLGGLLFALRSALDSGDGLPDRQPVTLSSERIERLRADFSRQWGVSPSPAQLSSLIEQEIDDELLEREARRLDLGLGDRSIRQRLIGKMRAVTDDPALGEEDLYRQGMDLGLDDDVVIRRLLREKMRLLLRSDGATALLTDEELSEALERHRDRFARDTTVSFTQVFVSQVIHGDGLGKQAAAVESAIRTGSLSAAEAVELADPFPLDARWDGRSRSEIARRFGDDFAAAVFSVEPERWSRPIASLFGLHLVRVHEKRNGGLPPLAAVRGQLVRILEEERAEARLAEGLLRLRGLYGVDVEWPEHVVAEAGP